VKIDINSEEAEAIHAALKHYTAYLHSQQREKSQFRRLEELFRKLARSK